MYEAFYGLRERPFDLTPNPRFLMLTATHGEALANLQYGVTARKGLTLLLGEAGVGKTTLIRAGLKQWEGAGHLIPYLNNPTLTRGEFIEYLTASFGLSPAAAASKTRFLAEFTALLTERHERDQITGLLIDEAQSLSTELLEEIRLLVNIETTTAKMLQVVLAGQPELIARLNEPGLRQLKQRIALRCSLANLSLRESLAYVAGRIQIAGGVAGQVFTREAVLAVHEHACGIPRVISVICDNALLAGFAAGARPVTCNVVEEVCRDFDLPRSSPARIEPMVTVPPGGVTETADFAAAGNGAARGIADRSVPAAATTGAAPRTTVDEQPAYPGLFDSFLARNKRRFSFF